MARRSKSSWRNELRTLQRSWEKKSDAFSEDQRSRLVELLHQKRADKGLSDTEEKILKEIQSTTSSARRNILLALGLSAAAAGFVYFGKAGDTEQEKSDSVSISAKENVRAKVQKTVERPKSVKLTEYKEWAADIELPESDFDPKQNRWEAERISDFFIPAEVTPEQLAAFYQTYDRNYDLLLAGLNHEDPMAQNPDVRMRMVSGFMRHIFEAYKLVDPSFESREQYNPKELKEAIFVVNHLLIPRGKWMTEFTPGAPGLDFYDVEAVSRVEARIKGQTFETPVVMLKHVYHAGYDPTIKSSQSIGGEYIPESGYITFVDDPLEVVERDRAMFDKMVGKTSSPSAAEVYRFKVDRNKASMKHEAMHMIFDKVYGVQRGDPKPVAMRGPVHLGDENGDRDYTLAEGSYVRTHADMLHELAGSGYGIMHSGDAARDIAAFAVASGVPEYRFAGMMMIYEILNSPHSSPSTKEWAKGALGGKPISAPQVARALNELPLEEIHLIGERMTKFAIHLTQEEKR